MKYLVLVFMLVVASVSVADWSENFDSYAAGSGLIGQGGWEGWDGDSAPDAYVTTTQFISAPHGIDIEPTSDVVQEFNIAAGSWVLTAWNYIPTGSTGKQYFILLTMYDGGSSDWALDLEFDSDASVLNVVEGAASVPIVYDTWVEVKVEVNLGTNLQNIYYNGAFLETIDWSTSGILELDALDLFSDGGSSIYWDDIELVEAAGALAPSTWAGIKTSM